MRNWYARFVLWLIRPAIELHRSSLQVIVSNASGTPDEFTVESVRHAIENPNSPLSRTVSQIVVTGRQR